METNEIIYIIRNEIRRALYIYKDTRNETIEMVDINDNPIGVVRSLTEDEIVERVIEKLEQGEEIL